MTRTAIAALLGVAAFAGCGHSGGPSASSSGAPAASSSVATAATTAAATSAATGAPAMVTREGSSIVRSPIESALWIADEDHSSLRELILPLDDVKARAIAMPGRPAQALGVGDRVLVTIRDPGLLVVVRSGAITARVALPDDAWGLAVAPDGKTAFVSSAWTHRVSAIDLDTLAVKWSVDVAREPRGLVVTNDGAKVFVNHLVGAAITRIDELDKSAPRVARIDLAAEPLDTRVHETTTASLGYAATLSPDGQRLFVARSALGSIWGWFGSSTVDVMVTADETSLAPARHTPAFGGITSDEIKSGQFLDFDAAGRAAGGNGQRASRAMIYRKATHTLLVAEEAVNSLSELDALAIAPALAMNRSYRLDNYHHVHDSDERLAAMPPTQDVDCGAPTGVALSADERFAYVHCRSTDGVATVKLDAYVGGQPEPMRGYDPMRRPDPKTRITKLDVEPMAADLALGRKLFYDTTDQVVSGGVSCATCHPDGRDDGFTWHEIFGDGLKPELHKFVSRASSNMIDGSAAAGAPQLGYARQTPMLAGRVKARGPYGWHAESADLVARIKVGFILHRRWDFLTDGATQRKRAEPLAVFLRDGLVAPKSIDRELTDEERRGKALFESDKTRCAQCHVPQSEYTDRSAPPLAQPKTPGADLDPNASFRVPSLLYVGGTGPYYHDGSVETLEELVEKNNDRMGHTAKLSAEEKKALVAFMKTL